MYRYDPNAFIFNLESIENKPLIFEHTKENNIKSSIFCRSDIGPSFGTLDIFIADKSNTNKNSFLNMGKTYINSEYPRNGDKDTTIIPGLDYFTVSEIEVFQEKHI